MLIVARTNLSFFELIESVEPVETGTIMLVALPALIGVLS
jgi:hypothetical protein